MLSHSHGFRYYSTQWLWRSFSDILESRKGKSRGFSFLTWTSKLPQKGQTGWVFSLKKAGKTLLLWEFGHATWKFTSRRFFCPVCTQQRSTPRCQASNKDSQPLRHSCSQPGEIVLLIQPPSLGKLQQLLLQNVHHMDPSFSRSTRLVSTVAAFCS